MAGEDADSFSSSTTSWWPQDTGLVAGPAAVANEVRARIAET
jgi:hypothetical protein